MSPRAIESEDDDLERGTTPPADELPPEDDNSESDEGEDDEDDEDEAPPAQEDQSTIEAKARRMGWKPKAEYSGRDKSRWVDAKTFIERGENELPIVRERLRKMDSNLITANREIGDLKTRLSESADVLKELVERSRRAEQAGFDRAVRELDERRRKAVLEADVAAYDAIEIEQRQLDAARTPPPPPAPAPAQAAQQQPPRPQGDPATEAWVAANPWFNTDNRMRMYAIAEDGELIKEYGEFGMTAEERLAEVRRRVVKRFPEKFEPTRRPARVFSNDAPPAPRPKGKTVRDLPPEARKALEKIKKDIPGYKDEDYLKLYFASEQ